MRLDDDEGSRRLITRLLNELQNDCGGIIGRAFDGELEMGQLFVLIMREDARRAGTAAGQGRHTSINGLATSLARPFETIRRHVHALSRRGLVVATPAGVMLTPAAACDPATIALREGMIGCFRFLIAELKRADVLSGVPAGDGHEDAECFLAAADLTLCALDYHAGHVRSWIELAVVGAVLILNNRSLNRDLVLSRRYAARDNVPPPEFRRPAKVAAIARQTGLPQGTVRRHLKQATSAGLVIVTPAGFIIANSWLDSEAVKEDARRILAYLRRVFRDLGAGVYRKPATDPIC